MPKNKLTTGDHRKLNSDYRGYDTGRKARKAGKPEPKHFDVDGLARSPEWIEWMQKGYYSHIDTPEQSDTVIVKCRIPISLRDKAVELGINRSQALEIGIESLIELKNRG